MEIDAYDPILRAYDILVNAYFCEDEPDLAGAYIAIEEAIGYLGEALAE